MSRFVTAIFPLKANSERIKNKNMYLLNGIPLCSYMLQTLISCECINEIIIDTDSNAIMTYIRKKIKSEKINIVERIGELRGDYVSMNRIIQHDIQFAHNNLLFQTHATNPFLKRKTIEDAIEIFCNYAGKYDSLFSVNVIQERLYNSDGDPINHNPNKLLRTQDMLPIYQENSNMYIFTKDSFIRNGSRIGKKPYIYVMKDKIESLDIDTYYEMKIAEIVLQGERNGQKFFE